jgi:hypothetical protein
MNKLRVGILFGILGSVLLVSSCKSDDEPGEDYRDNRGRVCRVDVSVASQPATCNVEPRPTNACPSGATPCFTVSPTLDSVGEVRNCDACCVNNVPGIPDFRDCGRVTCVTDGDCLYPNGRCLNSFCYRPANGGAGGAGGFVSGGAPANPSGGTGPASGGAPQGAGGASGGVPATAGSAGSPSSGSAGAPLGSAGSGGTGFAAGSAGSAGTPSGMFGGGSGGASGGGRAGGGQGGASAGRTGFPGFSGMSAGS